MPYIGAGIQRFNTADGLTVNGNAEVTTADNTTQLTLKSTDADASVGPVLDLVRDSGSPADNDLTGSLVFSADDGAGNSTEFVKILTQSQTVANGSEDGRIQMSVMKGGTARNVLDFTNTGVVFNEDSVDTDFRVESNGNANMLFVDAGNDRVGIGTGTVDSALHIEENASGVTETSGSTLKIHNTNASGRSKISLHNSGETASGSIYYDTDSGGLALQGDTGAIVAFHTGGNNERGRFDTSGRFLVGKTTSSISDSKGTVITDDGRVDINPSTTNGSGQVDAIRLHNSGTTAGDGAGIKFSAGTSTTGAGIFGIGQALNSANMVFRAGGDTERMRITSSGDVLINTTSLLGDGKLSIAAPLNARCASTMKNTASQAGGQTYIRFLNNADAISGSIQHTGTTTTNYGTSSDYRLKQDVEDMTGAIDRVKALAPKRFAWIADDDDRTVDGFLAHEAQTVVPEAVTGTHNGVETWTQQQIDDGDAPDGTSAGDNKLDGDGNTIPVMQQIDHSKLVPLLTGALREAITKIETLETEMTALKARVTALEDA